MLVMAALVIQIQSILLVPFLFEVLVLLPQLSYEFSTFFCRLDMLVAFFFQEIDEILGAHCMLQVGETIIQS